MLVRQKKKSDSMHACNPYSSSLIGIKDLMKSILHSSYNCSESTQLCLQLV